MPFPIAGGQAAVTRTLSGCLYRLEVELPGFQEDPKPDKLQVWVCEGVAEGGAYDLACSRLHCCYMADLAYHSHLLHV
jgi:hypothetical protein